jgi:hypothetical protein
VQREEFEMTRQCTVTLTVEQAQNIIDVLDNANSFCVTPYYDPGDLEIRNMLKKAIEESK